MYSALLKRHLILADSSLDPSQEFFCPECYRRVSLHRGFHVSSHFAHFPKFYCPRAGGGESFEHASLKVKVFNLLNFQVASGAISDLRAEVPYGGAVADLGFRTAGKEVAVEISCKNLSLEHARQKIEQQYRRKWVYSVWLFSLSVLKDESNQVLTAEKIIAAMASGDRIWVKLEGLYRVPPVLVYLHNLLHKAFLVLPSGLPAVIRLVEAEKKGRLWKVLVLTKLCYPLNLDLLVIRYQRWFLLSSFSIPVAFLSTRLERWTEIDSPCRLGSYPNNLESTGNTVREQPKIQINLSL